MVRRLAWFAFVMPALVLGCGSHHSGGNVPAPTTTATVQPPNSTPTPMPTTPGTLAWAVGPGDGGGVLIRSEDGGQTWSPNLTVDTSLDAVAFVDAATGYAVGIDAILRTDDGGTSWQPQQDAVPPDTRRSSDGVLVHYFSVAFVDALHGIVGGGGPFAFGEFGGSSEILVTDDGGKSWALAPISGSNPALHNSPVASLCITAAGIGLASGFGVSGSVILLLISEDGGHTWAEISAVTGPCTGRVACAGERDLWIASGDSANPVICHSDDGGTSWVDQSHNLASTTGEIRDIAFVDERDGWAVAFDTSARAVALRTRNGGSSWESHVLPLVPDAVFMTPQAIAATSSAHVVVVGSKSNAEGLLGPMALVTDDAGATWHASTLPSEVVFPKKLPPRGLRRA